MIPKKRDARRAPPPPPRPQPLDVSSGKADPDATVKLKARRGSPHPWIWRSMVSEPDLPRGLLPGQLVRVVDRDGELLGRAFWSPRSTIALRIVTHDPEETVDAAFFERKIGEALRFRREVLDLEKTTDGYRIVHAEADGLSGLMIDRLGAVVAVEVFGIGFARHIALVKEALAKLLPGVGVVTRADARSGEIEGFDLPRDPKEPRTSEVTEHGVRFKVDFEEGHKTGFFCDQRDNRVLWGRLVRGLRVLDAHSYTGGFALHAARGAASVIGVDLDETAIATAKKNANLNQVGSKVHFVHSDIFPYLRDAQRQGKTFEAISLDPPKLARDQSEVSEAIRTYSDLNKVALDVVAPGGFLLTCSCSGAVSEADFIQMLRGAASRSRRELQVFQVSGAAPDHPWALHAPEGRYLKAVFARVR
jgi:23S rRNA (cytosine1962-C5)-methyltransferase